MYIDVVPNRTSSLAILLRESVRQGKKVVKRTIANLSSLSLEQAIQLTLFDEQNLFEFTHADFPGERLIACRNSELAQHRRKTRTSLPVQRTRIEKSQGKSG